MTKHGVHTTIRELELRDKKIWTILFIRLPFLTKVENSGDWNKLVKIVYGVFNRLPQRIELFIITFKYQIFSKIQMKRYRKSEKNYINNFPVDVCDCTLLAFASLFQYFEKIYSLLIKFIFAEVGNERLRESFFFRFYLLSDTKFYRKNLLFMNQTSALCSL